MRRSLVWTSFALLGAVLLLLTTKPPEATLWVQPPDDPATAKATRRCPRGTLEDRGVCVPVPAPDPGSTDVLPLLPGRPVELDAYQPLVAGAVERLPLAQSPLPESLALTGDALVVRPYGEAQLLAGTLHSLGTPRVLEVSPEGGWLLLSVTSPTETLGHLVLLSGLSDVAPSVTSGAPLPAQGSIARVPGPLWFAARQLRPGVTPSRATDAWIDAASIPTDPRNILSTKPEATHGN